MNVIGEVAPSQVPTIETRYRRKDGSTFPVVVHVSILRDENGAKRGLVVLERYALAQICYGW